MHNPFCGNVRVTVTENLKSRRAYGGWASRSTKHCLSVAILTSRYNKYYCIACQKQVIYFHLLVETKSV